MSLQNTIHEQITKNCDLVCNWFDQKAKGLAFPIYTSFDLRDSGWKVVPVDANIFPAGFNNICQTDKDSAVAIMQKYLKEHYSNVGERIALLTEEHTANLYYWENVLTLKTLIEGSGYKVFICIPRQLDEPVQLRSASGREVTVYSAENRDGKVYVQNQEMDLIISNNDFSDSYSSWSEGLQTPMNPPRDLGWFRRRKFSFFEQYNKLAEEFSALIDVPKQGLQVETDLFVNFDVNDEERMEALAKQVDEFLLKLEKKYKQLNLDAKPFCFLKNNSGTYGLAVIQVHSGSEVRDWNGRIRKKMKAAKGGREVKELIIQEGVPTHFRQNDGGSAEPCVYMVGGNLVGGFLRTHSEKGPDENLNSPGAVFKKMCMADLLDDIKDCPMENVYGWVSKLAVLSVALEAKAGGIEFRGMKV